ncbi:Coiled-coil domain-containing protein [Actinidia chinensis var. chinensis]|uniref:Coiled-coil domain-containing protein n=1 Tax=Actinidia chinensis var. chinensis TaxID=1590841 RepID=A0A2R6QIA9_ACTCC|nr:Coiled-coil domain-containing protein [Actinidia chinensis var. chinensis]
MSGEEDSIEAAAAAAAAAAARRERLRALKAAQDLLNAPDDDHTDVNPNDQQDNLNMKFRNYLPHDKQLQEGKLAPPVLPKFEDPVAIVPVPEEKKEDPFVNIAPKKPNWDLRRDVQKKLDKLERRTQKAIFQLMEQQDKERQLTEEDGRIND